MTPPVSQVEPERSLRVLITNRTLSSRTGTELYVRDLAFGLADRGHNPVVYTPFPGDLAREIRGRTIPVTDDILSIAEAPDVVHGHHALETLTALTAFPGVPAIAFCHGWDGWADIPLRFPRIFRHVAVDNTCRDRLRFENGIPDEKIEVVLNSVDVTRFKPRSPLPAKPKRAVIFSNAAVKGSAQVPAIQAACNKAGIEVEIVGSRAGNSLARPEEVLGEFDLVFAKAKAALEALSVGCAVVLCDAVGAGPMVTTANVSQLRPLNFGHRAVPHALTSDYIGEQIAKYNAEDAAAVSRTIRETAGTDLMIDQLCAIYREAVDAQSAKNSESFQEESRAVAAYLQSMAPRMLQRDYLAAAFKGLIGKPFVGGIAARAARSERRSWLREILRLKDLD
jgi:hypothetical protein